MERSPVAGIDDRHPRRFGGVMTAVLPPSVHAVPVLRTVTSALSAADAAAAEIAVGAVRRDVERLLPVDELDRLCDLGLLSITVPAEYGGPDLPVGTVVEVVRRVSQADPNVGQIPHSHFVYVELLRHSAPDALRRRLFADVVAGRRFGNAQAEAGTRHARDLRTTLVPAEAGGWLLNGRKHYATGALLADWIPVLAHLGLDGPLHVAWVERTAAGVEVVDDWNGFGQRTTASGSVLLDDVHVAVDRISPYSAIFDGPQVVGAFAQVLHAAIDVGIARAALLESAELLRTRSRPYPDAGVERAVDDPLVVQAVGELELAVRSAEALLSEAARAVDAARVDLTEETAASASLAVAAARASTAQAALQAASRMFEVSGARGALSSLDLDRHWRNARTHTLHDPTAWKVQHLGRWVVSGDVPPNHGQI